MTSKDPSVYPETPAERTRWIRDLRHEVPRPHAASIPNTLIETERDADGRPLLTGTIFLINRECPWTCVMCDLWQHTTPHALPPGHAAEQLEQAIAKLREESPSTLQQIKIYNSGSFFDTGAVHPSDYASIAHTLAPFERVIVESHPRLVRDRIQAFTRGLQPRLEVAMGLEVADDAMLDRLNKRFTLSEYARAGAWLRQHEIAHRAFVMVQPPFVSPDSARQVCGETVAFAFEQGASCLSLIPTRATTEGMHRLQQAGLFQRPSLALLEDCFEDALRMRRGRVWVDLWDLDHMETCSTCLPKRRQRLEAMNRTQAIQTKIQCEDCR